MKKTISMLLIMMMLMGSTVTVFADTNRGWRDTARHSRNWSKAHVLYQMGLFKGKSGSTFLPALEDGSNRAEAIVLIGRAMGWPVDTGITSIPEYPDVPEWAAPYVRYALDHHITNGTEHHRFGTWMPVNARMVYTWYARALQYTEDVWEHPDLLVRLGLLTQSQADRLAAIDDDATRDLIVEIIFDSLNWRIRGSDMRLIQRLAKELRIDLKAAADAGLLEPEVTMMHVMVTAMSQKSIRLSFSQTLDVSTAVAANLEIKANGVKLTGYLLTPSEKEIIVTFQNAISAGTTLSVKVLPSLKSVTGVSADGSTKTIHMGTYDVAPAILDVIASSPSILQFTFSEPIASTVNEIAGLVHVNGNLATGAYVLNGTKTVLTLTLQGASILVEGTNNVKVDAGIRDVSNLTTPAYEKTLTVSVDTEPPSAVVTVHPGYVLQVQFNEQVEGFSSTSVSVAGVDESGVAFTPAVSELSYQASDKKGLVRFSPDSLPEGVSSLTVVLSSDIHDVSVNHNPLPTTTTVVAMEKDTTAPHAEISILDGFVIRILFNEEVDDFANGDFVLTGKDALAQEIPLTTASWTVVFDNTRMGATISVEPDALPVGDNVLSLQLLATILDTADPSNTLVPVTVELQAVKEATVEP